MINEPKLIWKLKESEIEKCFVKEILDLPNIFGTDPHKIKEFCETLTHSVHALETMGKLDNVKGNVSMTLDKLSGIRGDLVRGDPDWETWDFVKLTEAVNQWVRRNPATDFPGDREETKRKRVLNTKNEKYVQAPRLRVLWRFKPQSCPVRKGYGH